jgi:general secretion pathway protein B
MSYILEALKKAQAERQLGDLPTIHAPAIAAAPAAGAGLRNKPLVLALGALGIVTAGLLALVLRPAPPVAAPAGAPAPQAANMAGTATTAHAAALPAPLPVVAQIQTVAAPSPVAPTAPSTVPPSVAQTPVDPAPPRMAQTPAAAAAAAATMAIPPRSAVPRHAAPVPAKAAPPEGGAVAAAASPVNPAPSAAPAQDDTAQNLRDLPEPIQRAIPPVAVGGYIYSRNPADRLLLVDKVLRHEGEEVAPGLVLDKLLPKAAVFTFKGYRYRVPY